MISGLSAKPCICLREILIVQGSNQLILEDYIQFQKLESYSKSNWKDDQEIVLVLQ